MFAAPWVCRGCVRAIARPRSAALIRHASTDSPKLSGALLNRARKLSAEYEELNSSLSETFSPKSARRIGELSPIATALQDWDATQSSLAELESLLSSKDKELRELAKDELETTRSKVEELSHQLTVALTPKDPFAHLPCLVEIRPGPGGLEGRFFADTIYKMYRQYCLRRGLGFQEMKYEMADAAGDSTTTAGELPLQEAVFEIRDPGAYDLFRCEAGMHRVQRVPATESKGRVHTSAVAVWVLPSFADNNAAEEDVNNPDSDFFINPQDVRTETMRARGAGGQHVNKTESAIRLTHTPTGTVVSMQDSRSQQRNREDAWKVLRSRVALQRREEREEQAARLRNTVLAKNQITRGDKIRTYNYNQDRCTDHRSGMDVHNLPDVLVGGESFDKIIEGARSWLVAQDIATMVAEEEAQARIESESGDDAATGKKKK